MTQERDTTETREQLAGCRQAIERLGRHGLLSDAIYYINIAEAQVVTWAELSE